MENCIGNYSIKLNAKPEKRPLRLTSFVRCPNAARFFFHSKQHRIQRFAGYNRLPRAHETQRTRTAAPQCVCERVTCADTYNFTPIKRSHRTWRRTGCRGNRFTRYIKHNVRIFMGRVDVAK